MATQADVRSVATRSPPKLMEDEDGMVFEYLAEQEAEFLYEVRYRGVYHDTLEDAMVGYENCTN